MYNLENYKFPSLILLCSSVILVSSIRYFNEKETFNKINKNYKTANSEEKIILDELKVYPDCLSKSFSQNKKKKILLIIGGFRDAPNMWINFENYLQLNNIDYLIPRITGFARSYFQFNIKWHDWVLTIMDQINILQNLYEEIDILGFSTGCNIALYVSQFNWKCKINNLILSSPNLIANKEDKIFKSILTSNIGELFFSIVYPICHRPYESRTKRKNNKILKSNLKSKVFYEKNFPLYSACEMWKFQDILPSCINCNKIIVIKPNNDKVIGDIDLQINLIYSKYNLQSELINIPSPINSHLRVGHNIFTSPDIILRDVYNQIDSYLK
jgi:esterase/lipase